LGDYSKIRDGLDLVLALKERFQEAQGILRTLNMAPSTVARDKRWFREPWIFESQDLERGHYLLDYTYTCVRRVFNRGVLYVLP
jgi:hypothetical protein